MNEVTVPSRIVLVLDNTVNLRLQPRHPGLYRNMCVSADLDKAISQRFEPLRRLLVDPRVIFFRRFHEGGEGALIPRECICLGRNERQPISIALVRAVLYSQVKAPPLESARSSTPKLP